MAGGQGRSHRHPVNKALYAIQPVIVAIRVAGNVYRLVTLGRLDRPSGGA